MITPRTQAAIAVLNDIYSGTGTAATDRCNLSGESRHALLTILARAGLIQLSDNGNPQDVRSYSPTRESAGISLLDILEATGEHLNCNHPTTEAFYMRYGKAAQKLGILNLVTRTYLQEIKLYDL